MREKKKSLRLKKFKIANLTLIGLTGGDSFPCVLENTPQTTQQQAGESDNCCTRDNSTCSVGQMMSNDQVGCNGKPSPSFDTNC